MNGNPYTFMPNRTMVDPDLKPLRSELTNAGAFSKSYVLFGSAVMMMYGLRRDVGDIDMFVKPWLWGELIERGWGWSTPRAGDPPIAIGRLPDLEVEVHAFFEWDERHNFDDIVTAAFAGGEMVNDWHCQPLEQLLEWKRKLYSANVHPKHGEDAYLIASYLETRNESRDA
jgi:hypothetical protein